MSKRNSSELKANGLCPKCFKIKYFTGHHVYPKRYFNGNKDKLYLCRDCHDDLEILIKEIERGRKLPKKQYLEIVIEFLRG